jgi:hypothetical protein
VPPPPANTQATHFHEVFRPRSATQPSRATIPARYLPGSCCVVTLTTRPDAFLPQRSPWCSFNQARSRGVNPSELYLTEIAIASRRGIPSCDWQPTAVDRQKSLLLPHLPEIGRHKTNSSNGPRRARPSRIRGAVRFRRFRHRCLSGLASGVSSLCRLGPPSPDFSTCDVPGSLGFHPPWGIPLPDAWPLGCRAGLTTKRQLRMRPRQISLPNYIRACIRSASSCIPGRHPHGHHTLCLEFQRAGK